MASHGAPCTLCVLLALVCVACARQLDAQPQQHALGRRLQAVRDGRGGSGGGSLLRAGLSLQDAADARVCAMQCLQHACVSWSKIYMGESDGGAAQPGVVPATAAECLASCGMPAQEGSCLSQTFTRLLNTAPLQYSCGTSCIAGLLHSSCSQCSGGSGASGCHALQLGATGAAAECLVDAAV